MPFLIRQDKEDIVAVRLFPARSIDHHNLLPTLELTVNMIGKLGRGVAWEKSGVTLRLGI